MCRPDRKIIADASLRDRRIDILEAAVRPFVGHGFAVTSLEVSDEIGSAGGAIYCYYRSKPDLFLAVDRRAMELAQRTIRPPRACEGNVLERLPGTASAHAALVMERLPYLRAGDQELEIHLLERANEGECAELAQVRMRREANEALYIRVIKEGVASGQPRPVNLRPVARSLRGVLNRTLRSLHTHEGESGAARMAESIGEFIGGVA